MGLSALPGRIEPDSNRLGCIRIRLYGQSFCPWPARRQSPREDSLCRRLFDSARSRLRNSDRSYRNSRARNSIESVTWRDPDSRKRTSRVSVRHTHSREQNATAHAARPSNRRAARTPARRERVADCFKAKRFYRAYAGRESGKVTRNSLSAAKAGQELVKRRKISASLAPPRRNETIACACESGKPRRASSSRVAFTEPGVFHVRREMPPKERDLPSSWRRATSRMISSESPASRMACNSPTSKPS